MSLDAALKEGVEFVLHKLRQIGGLQPPRSARRNSQHAAGRGGTAWSVPGGGDRSEAGCHPTTAGSAGRRLAREAPEFATPHGVKRRLRLNRPEFCLPIGALCREATFGGLSACATDRFRAVNSRWAKALQGRKENFPTPPDSSHSGSQVTVARVGGPGRRCAAHHTSDCSAGPAPAQRQVARPRWCLARNSSRRFTSRGPGTRVMGSPACRLPGCSTAR